MAQAQKKSKLSILLGHKRRRSEGIPLLIAKFKANLATRLSPKQCEKIIQICEDQKSLEQMNFNEFSDLFWLG